MGREKEERERLAQEERRREQEERDESGWIPPIRPFDDDD